jgi:hypothetical protein
MCQSYQKFQKNPLFQMTQRYHLFLYYPMNPKYHLLHWYQNFLNFHLFPKTHLLQMYLLNQRFPNCH